MPKIKKKPPHVVIFGGSFYPPHAGHSEIIKRLLRRKDVDQVWVCPVFRHAFGKETAPFTTRLRWCRERFGKLGTRVKVKDVERRLGGVSFTVRLLEYVKARHPSWNLSLALGRDAYRERKAWKDFDKIEKMAALIVFPRGPKSFIPNISSTEIRQQWKKPKKRTS